MKSHKRNKTIFWIFVIGLAMIKQILVYDLPIYAISNALPDDGLMVYLAENLKNGQWLGNYQRLTLVKGIGYPLFLVISNILPFSYLSISSLFYTVSVLCMVYAVKPLFRTYKSLAALYMVLLFSPVAASLVTFQRVYRNSISAAQVLLIIGSFAGIYFRREWSVKRQMPWMFGAVLGLVSFYYTREDAIWILPFVVVVTLIYIGMVIYRYRVFRKKDMLVRILLILLPLLCMTGTGKAIGFLNQHYYGTSVVNELNSGSFAEMMKTIYSVEDSKELKQISVSRAKLKELYKYSPTLEDIQDEMDIQFAAWCGDEEYSRIWEVEDGWFFWILRDAMSDAGYYESTETMTTFCEAVTAELQQAMKAGNLRERPTMPSAMMSPWREGYFLKTLDAMWELHQYANSYEGLQTQAAYSVDDHAAGIGRFEKMTGNKAFCYENGKAEVSGWYASSTVNSLIVKDETGKIVQEVEWLESPDIAAHLQLTGESKDNSDRCRFTFQIQNDAYEGELYLCGYDENGAAKMNYALTSESTGFENEAGILNLDYCYILPNNNEHVLKITWKIDLLNQIHRIYELTGPYLWIVGAAMYLYATVRMFMGIKKGQGHIDIWLIMTGLLCSYLVLLGGIGYTHVSAFDAVNATYLSAGYPLITTFWCLGVLKLLEDVIEYVRKAGDQHVSGN